MQKVVYLVSKVNKNKKLKGVGYLIEGNLLIPATSSKGSRSRDPTTFTEEEWEVLQKLFEDGSTEVNDQEKSFA